jgi:hypothetical protein
MKMTEVLYLEGLKIPKVPAVPEEDIRQREDYRIK